MRTLYRQQRVGVFVDVQNLYYSARYLYNSKVDFREILKEAIRGRGDFIPLVEHLKRAMGCKVEVMAFGRSTSSKLIEVADEFIDLDSDPNRFLLEG